MRILALTVEISSFFTFHDPVILVTNLRPRVLVYFGLAQFASQADFGGAQFDSLAYFGLAQFASQADFSDAHFESRAYFRRAEFESRADFSGAQFASLAYFDLAQFESHAYFSGAQFASRAYFIGADFKSLADFSSVKADTILFDEVLIAGTLLLGTYAPQTYPAFDLRTAILRPTTQIELLSPVHITIQREKITHLTLASYLRWDKKKRITDDLKTRSFAGDEAAHFEIDYLFERSTMFEGYTERWYDPIVYILRAVYWAMMGLGYRPFRIFIWAGVLILVFAFYYRRKMPRRIYDFVQAKEKRPTHAPLPPDDAPVLSALNPWIHCLYFSTSVFFTFRLKQKILTFFDTRERRVIVFQWVLGFSVYLAFLTLSKSGSILQQLKTLFIG